MTTPVPSGPIKVVFHTTQQISDRIDACAQAAGMTRSDWLRLAVGLTDTTQVIGTLEQEGVRKDGAAGVLREARGNLAAFCQRLLPRRLET